MKFLRQLFLALVYLLPAALFFSYHPLIYLGQNSTMNFELSLHLIWLALFGLVTFILIVLADEKRERNHDVDQRRRFFLRGSGLTRRTSAPALRRQALATRPAKGHRCCWWPHLALLFPIYAGWSIFWSPNPFRALLTSGILWLVVLAIAGFVFILPRLAPPTFRATWLKTFFVSTAAVCLFCWLQSALDLAGCPRETTLLCPGCTAQTFGFPHPSGFAIEPQFMGNLLLAPALTALYLLVFKKSSPAPLFKKRFIFPALTFLFSATLFFTLSRGAIYAFACALLVLLVFALKSRANWRALVLIPLSAFIFTLAAQGTFAALGPTSDDFVSGATKSLHQLSLGIIDLRPASVKNPQETSQASPESTPATSPEPTPSEISPSNPAPQSRFDGYIASSTNERTGLNALALATWHRNLPTILFGVGLGGAGLAMSETFPANPLAAPNALVQNQFLSLLLELGLLGIILLAFSIWRFIALLLETIRSAQASAVGGERKESSLSFLRRRPAGSGEAALDERVSPATAGWRDACPEKQGWVVVWCVLVAYLITLNFFSGLPNALQIYLLPPLLFFIFCANSRKNSCASQK